MSIRANFDSGEFEVRKNDTYSTFSTILTEGSEDENASAIDISNVTTKVILNVLRPDGVIMEIPANKGTKVGEVYHKWQSGELDIVGKYTIEPRIIFDGGERYTSLERIKFKVIETITGV